MWGGEIFETHRLSREKTEMCSGYNDGYWYELELIAVVAYSAFNNLSNAKVGS